MQENPEDCIGDEIPAIHWVYKRVPTQNANNVFDSDPKNRPPFTYVPPGIFQYKRIDQNEPAKNTRLSVNWPKCPTCQPTSAPGDVIPENARTNDKFRIIKGKVENIKKGTGVNKVIHDPEPPNEAHSLICIEPYTIDKEDYNDVRQDLADNFEWLSLEGINDEENEIFIGTEE